MKKFSFAVFLWLAFLSRNILALTPGDLIRQADQAYHSGRYQEAIQSWQALSKMGFVNGDIYDNMASAYWRQGKVGEARLYFLKAKRLLPRDPALRENLDFIEEKIEKIPPPMGPWVLLAKIPFYRAALNEEESLCFSAGLSFLFFSGLAIFRLKRSKFWLVFSLFLVFPLGFSILSLGKNIQYPYFSKQVVVLVPKAELYSAPTTDAKIQAGIPEGILLKLLREQGDFALVKTPEGKEAWVEAKNVGEV